MSVHIKLLILIKLVAILLSLVTSARCKEYDPLVLKMPNIRPRRDDSYLCVATRVDPNESKYVVGFLPNATASRIHHMLIYGCSFPGKHVRDTPNYVWECGEMGNNIERNYEDYEPGPPCASDIDMNVLFGWALDAPPVDMPPKVGFRIGKDSDIKYLILQVHYGHTKIFRENKDLRDNSGITLKTVTHGITRLAGLYLFYSYGYIQQGPDRHSMTCNLEDNMTIHPFRFRTHTHKLGHHVAGYVIPHNEAKMKYLIGEGDPQEPQMFYEVKNKTLTISRGDKLHAYCDYYNDLGETVMIGSTGNEEMCNFYFMYWTEEHRLVKKPECSDFNPHR